MFLQITEIVGVQRGPKMETEVRVADIHSERVYSVIGTEVPKCKGYLTFVFIGKLERRE